MVKVPANGVEYNVEVSGQGPPILALHGFTGSASTWRPMAQALGAEHTICAVDLLGHGASSKPSDPERYSMARTIEDLGVVLDALGHAAANVLGYSMGGRIALSFALAAPDRCLALAIESGSPGIADDQERAQRVVSDEALARQIESGGVQAFVDYWEAVPLFATQAHLSQETREGLRALRLSNDPMGLAGSLRGIGTGAQPPVHSAVPTLAVPALFLAGELDARYCEVAREMASASSMGRVSVVSGAGHAIHLERPDAFHDALRSFFLA